MALAPADQQKLARLLGMLGSSADGEALNAARLAQRLITAANVTWAELVAAPAAPTPAEIDLHRIELLERDAFERGRQAGLAERQEQPRSFPAWADHCLHQCTRLLTAWETKFLDDFIAKRWSTPTPKQRLVFERISARCGLPLPLEATP
jgi:hypothetical protein